MDFGGLKDGAAGCGEPAEAAGFIETAYGAAGLFTEGNGSKGVEVVVEFIEIELRVECEETVALLSAAEAQKFQARAIEDDSNVKEFFAVDAGDDANDGIFKQVRF
jgi:hypothetical protein